jgi:hypothetical protein
MVCAGLAETSGRGTTVRQQRKAFLPFERGWALAVTLSVDGRLKLGAADGTDRRGLRPEFQGLRGANRVLAHFRTLGDRPRVRPPAYTLLQAQDAQGGLGAYLITLRQFGLVHPESLVVTSQGRALAASFAPHGVRGGSLRLLAEHTPVDRQLLARMGRVLSLGSPTREERDLVREAIFENERSGVADVVSRMRAARPKARAPRELLAGIARTDGDQIERAAAYALAFDPLRVAALTLFARLGEQLASRGSSRLSDLETEPLQAAATDVRNRAPAVAEMRDLPGLAPISKLARELATAGTLGDTISSLVSFHRREERSWVVAEGPQRYRLGRHGRFQEPPDA